MRLLCKKVSIMVASLVLLGLTGCDAKDDEPNKWNLIECSEGMWLKNLKVIIETGPLAYKYTKKDFRMTNRYLIKDIWGEDWEGELRINRMTGEYVATYKRDSSRYADGLTQEGTCKFNGSEWKEI